MDIKDLIIIAGSIFFVVIVAHGLWVVRKNRLNEIHMDIQSPDSIRENVPEGRSSELPNGGARVISQALQNDSGEVSPNELSKDGNPLVTDAADRLTSGARSTSRVPKTEDLFDSADLKVNAAGVGNHKSKSTDSEPRIDASDTGGKSATDTRRQDPKPEELLILGVMSKAEESFGGEELVAALRGQGLKFGDMGIFHRRGSDVDDRLFSVANALEPGTFDLSDLDALQTPGLTFFMQLPVPGDALETLEDMILSARTVAAALGGEVKDDTMSALTGQTEEHMKQRIADFARKQLTAPSDG